jgi:hypothetical protein
MVQNTTKKQTKPRSDRLGALILSRSARGPLIFSASNPASSLLISSTRISLNDVEELLHCPRSDAPQVGVVPLAVHGEGLAAAGLTVCVPGKLIKWHAHI